LLGNATLNIKRVIIEKLFAQLEIALRINKYAGLAIKAIFSSFATRLTRMINPAGCIAAILGINAAAILKSMVWIFWVMRMPLFSQLPTDALALVLNNGIAFFNGLYNEHAFAMNWGRSHNNAGTIDFRGR
jgi:hypothetical protein